MFALQSLMQGEVRQLLAGEELLAVGIAVPLNSGGAPEKLSPLLFSANITVIDWESSTINGLGCSFNEVRVVSATSLPSCPATVEIQEISVPNSVSERGRGGRKDTYPLSEQVLRCLFQADGNQHLSAERLHSAFKVEFERQVSVIPAPSIRTLRGQLKRFRQKSAETGNNEDAD